MWQVTLVSSKKDTAVCTYLADLSLEAFLRLFEPLLSLLSSGDLLLFGLPRDLDNPEPDLPPNPLFPIGWRLTSLKWLGRGCGLRLTEKIFAWSALNVYPKNCDTLKGNFGGIASADLFIYLLSLWNGVLWCHLDIQKKLLWVSNHLNLQDFEGLLRQPRGRNFFTIHQKITKPRAPLNSL